MSAVLWVRLEGDLQTFEPAELPRALVLGNDRLTIAPGTVDAPLAWLAIEREHVYLQPADGVAVSLNDAILVESAWLRANDRFEIEGHGLRVVERDGVLGLDGDFPRLMPPSEPPATSVVPATPETPPAEPDIAPDEAVIHVPEEEPPGASGAPPAAPGPLPRRRPARRMRLLLVAAFAMIVLGVGFVLVAVPVRLTVVPAPESLAFAGTFPSFELGERQLVLPGRYRVTAARTGYHALDRTVEIDASTPAELRFELAKLPGRLELATTPAIARISIDGTEVTLDADGRFEVEAGPRQLRVDAPRYLPHEQTIEIEGMGRVQSVVVSLTPGWASARVESDPPGANVELDGESVGLTPLNVEPMAGSHRLDLSLPGFKPQSFEFDAAANSVVAVPTFTLEKADGVIELASVPSGASVFVSGDFVGRTPLPLTLRPDENHRLRLTRPGHAQHEVTVQVKPETVKPMSVRLTPEFGTVFVIARPGDAELTVDGEPRGRASQRLRLSALPHRLEIAPGISHARGDGHAVEHRRTADRRAPRSADPDSGAGRGEARVDATRNRSRTDPRARAIPRAGSLRDGRIAPRIRSAVERNPPSGGAEPRLLHWHPGGDSG